MEYAGFKKAEGGPVKWGEIATKITGDLAKIDTERQEKRDKIQDTFDTAQENLNDIPQGQNKGFNQFVIDGASGQRDFRVELAKRIQAGEYTDANGKKVKLSPTAGTQMLQNADAEWSAFSRLAKNYNEDFASMMKRQQKSKDGKPAPAGAFELLLGSQRADLSDLRNKNIISDPNTGRMYLETTDAQGNVTRKSLSSINNNENQLADRVDVSGIIKNQFKNAGDYKVWTKNPTTGKWQMVADQRLRNDFGVLKTSIKNTVMGNDRNIFSVLADNADSKFTGFVGDTKGDDYKNKLTDLRQRIFDEATAAQNPMTMVQAEAEAKKFMVATKEDEMGNLQPTFTDEQRKHAGEYVDHMIDAQAGHTESQPPGVGTSSTAGVKKEEKRKLALTIYGDSATAVNTGDFSRFSDDFRYEIQADGSIQVSALDKKQGKFMVKTIIPQGDHKALSKYHENWNDIDAGLYDEAEVSPNAPQIPGYTKPEVYTPQAMTEITNWTTNEDLQEGDLGTEVHAAIKQVFPNFAITNITVGKKESVEDEWETMGDWTYKRPVTINGVKEYIWVGASQSLNKDQLSKLKKKNEVAMNNLLKASKGIKPPPGTGGTSQTNPGAGGGGASSGGTPLPPTPSDIALKEDISLVGQSASGINIYEFKYINKPGRYRGVMAQEVPWASIKQNNGYLAVDYSKIDVEFEKI